MVLLYIFLFNSLILFVHILITVDSLFFWDWIIVVMYSCMQRSSTVGDLIPNDLEINATCRKRNSERIINFLQDLEAAAIPEEEPRSFEASSSFPIVSILI